MENQIEGYEAPRPPRSVGRKDKSYLATREPLSAQGDALSRYPVIFQTFLDVRVRFFKLDFNVETSGIFKRVQTWAIALQDLALATGYPEKLIRRMILLNDEFFLDFCKVDFIMGNEGDPRSTMFIAVEMIAALTMKIQTWETKDPKIRKRVRAFQRWVVIILDSIRRHKLHALRWIRSTDINSRYIPLLCVPSGREHKRQVINLARMERKSLATIYRHLGLLRGSNILTAKGVPRGSRKAP
jgi:hypothetical protein